MQKQLCQYKLFMNYDNIFLEVSTPVFAVQSTVLHYKHMNSS